ncbi:MAG: hypothetical protein RIC03_01720 [Cyclobacteriaceae bacterium]
MKPVLFLFLVLTFSTGFSQTIENWTIDFQLELSDFQSPQTEINENLTSYSIYSGSNMDFSFQMSTYEFMFTKNFNTKVKTTFNRNAAVITAPDSTTALQLVNFGQYSFDLTELYTRKFRQRMYEEKGAFSDVNFFKPIFENLQEEMNAESARVLKVTDLGREAELLNTEHQKVLIEIGELSNFCYYCKPPKKKKKG